MAEKNIILLLDGTWNDADFGVRDTNIVRMRQIIAKSLDKPSPHLAAPMAAGKHIVDAGTYHGVEQIVFYERGVGTGLDWLRGGALGDGLDNNIRRAYKFLSYYYEPGDKIFIFGFSRGAYTARSLVGFIAAAGLLRRENCTADHERAAWTYYRTSPNDRLPGVWVDLKPLVHTRETFTIECVGVFDTVGALGVPLKSFWRLNRQRYEFHNVELSSITKVNLHALALDEHRHPFQAAVWRKPMFKSFQTVTEQVWFPGAHADVGGSYIDETKREVDRIVALDDIPLDWLLKRVKDNCPGFPFKPGAWSPPHPASAQARAHEARKGIYRFWPFAQRMPANYARRPRRWLHETTVCQDRHADPIAEMVHISVLWRLGKKVRGGWFRKTYRPWNLRSVLNDIEQTYCPPPTGKRIAHDILIVDWSGRPLQCGCHRDKAIAIQAIHEAQARLRLRPANPGAHHIGDRKQPSFVMRAAQKLASPLRPRTN
jgi:Uncharacterized alpha/beta hydrolase domain (DUF2235)